MSDFRSDPSYIALRSALGEGTTQVVAFVGAGLSVPAGLPTWAQLKRRLVEVLRAKAAGFDPTQARTRAEVADKIATEPDYWVAFSMLRNGLGKATYEAEIRAALAPADQSGTPPAYELVWRIPRLEGVATLNLDRFVTRAFSVVHSGSDLKHFVGADAGRLQRLLHSGDRFAFNLHGTVDDSASWVLTKEDLNRLLRGPAYKQLLNQLFTTYTVLFIGIGVDDLAIGGPLHDLARNQVQGRTHYWITDRRDESTEAWAESHGIRVIRYGAPGGDHAAMSGMLADLAGYKPTEIENPRPVTLRDIAPLAATDVPTPEELVRKDIADIREILNRRAVDLLPDDDDAEADDDAYRPFEEFLDAYDQAVHSAWYTSDRPGRNTLFDYVLDREIASGAFGKVYRATTSDGEVVAIKVLLEEIRRDPKLVKSFRRGVRAMRILQRHGVDGMVGYREATEIPAFVCMDWIEGPNLAEAKEARQLEEWSVILRIANDVVSIIRRAHALPERVLHRDLRPSNIMLRNFYTEPDGWDVVVLDFDLAWHRGAAGKSVVHTTAYGYLAPEQVRPRGNEPTRSAAVDVFGLGMTFLFLCGGKEPAADEHNHRNYERFVHDAMRGVTASSWRSLPARMARLVLSMTRDVQAERVDLGQVSRELALLASAHASPDAVESAELLCEEVAATTDVLRDYVWSPDTRSAVVKKPTGLTVVLNADEATGELQIRVTWDATGQEERTGLGRHLTEAAQTAQARLKTSGWDVSARVERGSLALSGSIAVQRVTGNVEAIAAAIDRSLVSLRRGE